MVAPPISLPSLVMVPTGTSSLDDDPSSAGLWAVEIAALFTRRLASIASQPTESPLMPMRANTGGGIAETVDKPNRGQFWPHLAWLAGCEISQLG